MAVAKQTVFTVKCDRDGCPGVINSTTSFSVAAEQAVEHGWQVNTRDGWGPIEDLCPVHRWTH